MNHFSKEIQQLQYEKKVIESEFTKKINQLKSKLLDSLGSEDMVVTKSFIITKNYPNAKSQTSYRLDIPTEEEARERLVKYLRNYDLTLVKEETSYKPIQKNIKQLIIDDYFHFLNNGSLVDDNGEIIPDIKVSLKDVEPRIKIKK